MVTLLKAISPADTSASRITALMIFTEILILSRKAMSRSLSVRWSAMQGRVHTSSISVDLIAGVARDEAQRLQARVTAVASARRARSIGCERELVA